MHVPRLVAITLTALVATILPAARLLAAEADAAGIEFYESKIRPLLVEHCHRCHGADKQEGNLRLDRAAAMSKGGDRGPAVVPGKADKSWLIVAIGYKDEELQMPPKGRLSEQQIADLTAWVTRGAPAPADGVLAAGPKKTFDLAERRQHWSYQPVTRQMPPPVKNGAWVASPIDAFVLAKLEAAGLQPAAPADKRTLIRRVTFDLIGLPPTPEEIAAFEADQSPAAFEHVVERLLASPHYGERWGRHWLDLVRYAETLGHEFDFELHNAWRYRDYVVRAFNADLPYDQFLVEHLAGDLLRQPRRHPTEGFNESILGTGFFWLGEGKHSPVDIRQEQANHIDNQIDVLAKTFLAQTIACARCHDHKFDAITAQDYYALAGYLKSTRYQQAPIGPSALFADKVRALDELQAKIVAASADTLQEQVRNAAYYLLAASGLSQATGSSLNADRVASWMKLVATKEAQQATHPLYAWSRLVASAKPDGPPLAQRAAELREALTKLTADATRAIAAMPIVEDFNSASFEDWSVVGDAFQTGPSRPGDVVLGDTPSRAIGRLLPAGWAHSGRLSKRLEGALRSPTFTIEHPHLHFRAAGRGTRINLVIDGFTIIRSPIYGGLTIDLKDDEPVWRTMDLSMWQGHRAYIELLDTSVPNQSHNLSAEAAKGQTSESWLAVDEIRWSSQPGTPPNSLNLQVLAEPTPTSPQELAERYRTALLDTLRTAVEKREVQNTVAFNDTLQLINVLLSQGLLDAPAPVLVESRTEFERIEASLTVPMYAPAAIDGTGADEHVFNRGNYRTPGDVVPRRLSEVLCSSEQPPPERGSGRLELARRLIDPTNPLVARVMVNRIWQHHFGQGIVRSPDDFGRMGQPPTHPELLDYLAAEFVRRGWSIKQMHRQMLLSSTYRMSSRGAPSALQADPENKLLHHLPIRRLEAEAIRDAVLAVSGRLDRRLGGTSVMPFLTSFMEGRGRPGGSGPLDGDGRRSLYINVRRNFLTPMFLAFDYPIPFSSIGRRTVSNVPAQALSMMNGPFIAQEAKRWADATLSQPGKSADERIAALYERAFGRKATPDELTAARAFVDEQAQRYGQGGNDPRAWTDLCHVLLNVKEFIFIE